ncbi:MAG: EamA family transporter [Ferruginibacter sp.]|nr:EamA family transporter [Ferruginibacter sp.]
MRSSDIFPKGKAGGYFALGITSVVWGTTWVASKIGVTEMPPLQMASIRQFLGGICFVTYFIFFKGMALPTRRQFSWLIVLSILMFVFANGLSTWSLLYIPTGLSALIGALYPLSVVIIERVFYRNRNMTLLTFAGLLIGIAGIGIVFYESAFAHRSAGFLLGIFLSVLAMLSWSVGTIFIAKNKLKINPYYGTGWQMLISSGVLFIVAYGTQPIIPITTFSLKAWLVIVYLVLGGSLLSFVAFIYSMKKLSPAVSSLYAYFNPLVAMLTAALLLNEHLTMNILWGALVTLSGVFLVNYSIKQAKKKLMAGSEQ